MHDYSKIRIFIPAILIFLVALFLRLHYFSIAQIDNPMRGDTREYYFGALNLSVYGVYNNTKYEKSSGKPEPGALRPPLYSLFLLPFIESADSFPDFYSRVIYAQCIIGSLCAVITFMAALPLLGIPAASAAGLLLALSPHHISINTLLLSETIFTFLFLCAALMLTFSWKKEKIPLYFCAGFFFGLIMLTKSSAMLTGFFAAAVYMLKPGTFRLRKFREWKKPVITFITAMTLVFSVFIARNLISTGTFYPESGRGWMAFVLGSVYIDLVYEGNLFYQGYPDLIDPEYKLMHKDKSHFLKIAQERIKKQPAAYLRWYTAGKQLFLWRWDLTGQHGDAYIFPMINFPFRDDPLLSPARDFMKAVHSPLVVMSLFYPFLLIFLRRTGCNIDSRAPVITFYLIIFYFMFMVFVLVPYPRYSIQLRPFMYITALLFMYDSFSAGRRLIFRKKKES